VIRHHLRAMISQPSRCLLLDQPRSRAATGTQHPRRYFGHHTRAAQVVHAAGVPANLPSHSHLIIYRRFAYSWNLTRFPHRPKPVVPSLGSTDGSAVGARGVPRWDSTSVPCSVDGPHVFGLGRRETVRYSPTNGLGVPTTRERTRERRSARFLWGDAESSSRTPASARHRHRHIHGSA